MFNISLEVLQEASDQITFLNWPQIKVMILELSCDCYWNLEMKREYLRKKFELILIRGPEKNLNENDDQCDKVNESAVMLDDTIIFELDKFFRIDNLDIKESSIHALFSSNFVLVSLSLIVADLIFFEYFSLLNIARFLLFYQEKVVISFGLLQFIKFLVAIL